jgi:RNA polymerase sigma factor (sigma-70 family)
VPSRGVLKKQIKLLEEIDMEILDRQSPSTNHRKFLTESDENLVAAAKNGEHRAYNELCRRHAKRTFHTVQRFTRNIEDAEDAVQESLMKAFAHLATFDGRSAFSTWLTRIAINSALMALRKKRNIQEFSLDVSFGTEEPVAFEVIEPSCNPEDACLQDESDRVLRHAVSRLSPSLKRVMEARHTQDASIHEIAAMLGISEAATKSRLLRGRAALRVTLDRLERRSKPSQLTAMMRMKAS